MGIEAHTHRSSLYSHANETVQLEQANPMVNGITRFTVFPCTLRC